MTTHRRKVRQNSKEEDRSASNFYSPPKNDGFFQTEDDSDENTTTNLTPPIAPHPPANVYNRNSNNAHVNNQPSHHFISQPTRRRRVGSGHSRTKSPNSRIRHRRRDNPTSYNLPQNHASHPIARQELTFATALSDLITIICVFASGYLQSLRLCTPRIFRKLAVGVVLAIIIFITLMVIIIFRFLHLEVAPLCTPPSWEQSSLSQHPPLVEYYVHGRGNGHYARSVAIVEQLLAKGIDVRMFIGRATMWRAVNTAHGGDNTNFDSVAKEGFAVDSQERNAKDNARKIPTRGQVTVTSVASILPSLSIMDCVSLLIERVLSDCEIAKNTNRYPLLVISDGELPGMLRAQMGSIPSVSLAHGQTFVIGQRPSWVANDAVLSTAWKKQRALNSRTSYDANWIIATNFVDIPVNGGNGVIARSPIRPEVVRMGNERQTRKRQFKYMDESGDVLSQQEKIGVKNSFMSSWQQDKINQLLLGKNNTESLKVVKRAIERKQIEPFERSDLTFFRRKLVICYFRDKNGDLLTNALLRSGFDVLLFERGYHKGLSDVDDEKKFGQDLVVHRRPSTHTSEIDEDGSLMDHWVNILARNNRRLLNENTEADQIGVKKKTEISGDTNSAEGTLDSSAANGTTPNLQDSVEIVKNLMKSAIGAPRIIRVTDMSLFVPLLSIADGVASSAGSQLLSECIYSHLNVLALHQADDAEQRLNIAFTKHRFDRLSKESSLGLLNSANMDYYASENVVHGMSLENFANVFDTISRHEKIKDEFETILTDAEEAMLLRTHNSRQTYTVFKAYVKAVRQSPISWSYYHDLYHGILASNPESTILDGKDDKLAEEEEHEEYIDPFQGMPEAAGVILEIIDDLTKKHPSKT